MRPWERNAKNLSASLCFYGQGEFRGGVQLITSRVSYSVFNIALLTDPVSDMDSELDRRIQLAGNHYRDMNRQWSFWICEDYLGPRNARRLMPAFESRGLVCIAESPGMETPDLVPARRTLPELEYRRVQDAATRTAFSHIVSQCFHIPNAISQVIYEAEEPWSHRLEVWLGYRDGYAVTSTALIEEAGAIGIYSVATLPAFRGQGLAEATMRNAISDMRRRGAEGPLILQSSPSGLDLYRKLGFKRTTRYFVFATE